MTYLVAASIIIKSRDGIQNEAIREFKFNVDSPIMSADLLNVAKVAARKRWKTASIINIWEV